jgi:hypothetical protein
MKNEKWRYIKFYADAGYAGTHEEWYGRYSIDIPDSKLDTMALDYGDPYCCEYEYLHTGHIHEDDYATYEDFEVALEEATEDYWENYANWGWVEISEEEFYDIMSYVANLKEQS